LEDSSLSDKPLPKKQEEKLRKLAKELFLNEYPNPERKGCPDSQTIRAIAFGKLRGEQARQWQTHFATCSPCTREYAGFRQEFQRVRRLRALSAVAAAVVLAVIAGWLALTRLGSRGQSWQQASLDLRGHEAFRGAESPQTLPPLELARARLELSLDLPTGSEAGNYDIQVVQGAARPVATARGTAELVGGVAVLKVRIDLGQARPGPSSLLVRRPGQSWTRYAVLLR
jgi:hypothetical protein